MGFIDYVVEYFKGPQGDPGADGAPGATGLTGATGAAGPALTVNQSNEAFSYNPDPSEGYNFVTVAAPTGKSVKGVVTLGDKSVYSHFTYAVLAAGVDDNPDYDQVVFAYLHTVDPGSPTHLDVLLFLA